MDRLKAFAVFKAVVEHGSFAKAARETDSSCAAVTRIVQELEALLGARLLQRSTRSLTLTSIGHEVLQRATAMLASYEELTVVSALTASDASGKLRVLAPLAYGQHHLGAALAGFIARYPRVSIDLQLREGELDLGGESYDLALCSQRDLRPALIARRLTELRVGVYAAPSYAARRGGLSHPAQLLPGDCLGGDGLDWQLRRADSAEPCKVAAQGALNCSNTALLLGAALHGAGVVLLPEFAAESLCADGRLLRLFPAWEAEPMAIHLAYQSRQHQPYSVAKLSEHLIECLGSGARPALQAAPPLPPPRRMADRVAA